LASFVKWAKHLSGESNSECRPVQDEYEGELEEELFWWWIVRL